MKSFAFLAATILLITEPKPAESWDQADRDQTLKMHNEYRNTTVKEKGACHMNLVEYDMDMEKDAEAYAKKCHYQHVFDKYGENFAFDTNTDLPQSELIKSSVDAWYGEIKTYKYDQDACGDTASCHYTQIVASSLKKIGCYTHVCDNLVGGAPNAWFMVCYYTPKGNWRGEVSYPKKCKTPCLEEQTEEEGGLCSGEGVEEGAEKFECKDVPFCHTWKASGQCEANPTYMKKKCPVACEECVPEGGVPEIGCIDNDPRCPSWSQRGYCVKKAAQLKERCPKSCKHCS